MMKITLTYDLRTPDVRNVNRRNFRQVFKNFVFLNIGLLPLLAFAQQTITGKVFDITDNKPLADANVFAEGNTVVLTDVAGEFSITLNASVTSISVSYVGYETSTIRINGRTNLSIGLKPLESQLRNITVVGTRNLSRSKGQTAVAVDIIPISALAIDVAQVDINQILTYVAPSFQSSRQTVADGTDHIDPAQLRGLGSDQVLVLVNGKRRHQSALVNVNGTVNRGQVGTDLSAIPVSAIDHIEILRDGASAQYGSDAIAGVINVVLKNTTGVLSGDISFGENITSYSKDLALQKMGSLDLKKINVQDGGTLHAGLNYGLNLGKGGSLNLTGEYTFREATNRAGIYTGQLYPSVNGANRDDSVLSARGLSRDYFDMRIGSAKVASGAFTMNGLYMLGAGWELKWFGSFSAKAGEAAGFYRYPSGLSAAGMYTPQVMQLYPNGFLPLIKSDIKDYSFSASIGGMIANWNATLSNTIGINRFDFTVDHSVNYTQYAVRPDPQTKFDAGGLQFLQNSINLDFTRSFDFLHGLNVAYGAEFRVDQYSQHAGEEASYKNYNTASGAAAGAQVFSGFVPTYAGKHSRNNIALYSDIEQDFTRNWLVQGALRFENYSDFGATLDYKLASRYKMADWVTARAAASTGFRAPSLQQQFYSKTNTLFVSTSAGLVPTESGTFTNNSKPAQILGIPKLKEETSQNYSLGFAFNPIKNLELSVDGYLIKISNRIILTNNFNGGTDPALAQLLKDNGATTANFFTNAIDTRARGLEAVASYHFNFAGNNRFRLTAAASFIKNEVVKGADGKPLIKASQILVNSGQIGNYFNREDQSRFEVASPSAKANLTVNYIRKRIGAMVRFAYFGKVIYLDPTINPDNPSAFPVNTFTGQKETLDQEFSPKTVTDLSLNYSFKKHFVFTIGANNFFDVYQDAHTHSGNISLGRFVYSRRVEQMGFNGRFVFARLSFSFSANKESGDGN
jgi:iron complex outermembrane recepter protein